MARKTGPLWPLEKGPLQRVKPRKDPFVHGRPVRIPNTEMGMKVRYGGRIKRQHLHAFLKRDRLPQRAVEATEAVDKFLLDLGLDALLPDSFGVDLPSPKYMTDFTQLA